MGILYLVATPIGNLEDMSYRSVRILSEVDYIAAEDTRHTLKLLNHFDISKKMVSYHEHNKAAKGQEIITDILNGKDVALVTDAGTPAISDPGEDLVKLCHEAGIEVTSVPGPVALITGLILSGLDTRRFVFEGFLPMKKKERLERLTSLSSETRTMIFYEAPHKLKATLKDFEKTFGETRLVVLTRELTKKFEEIKRVTVEEALAFYNDNDPRGEYVVMVEGLSDEAAKVLNASPLNQLSLEEHLAHYLSEGLSKKEAIKCIAKDREQPKRDIYNYFIDKE